MGNNLAHDLVEDRVENLIEVPAIRPIEPIPIGPMEPIPRFFFQCAECPNESTMVVPPVFITRYGLINHMWVKHGVILREDEDALKLLLNIDYIESPFVSVCSLPEPLPVPSEFNPLTFMANNPEFQMPSPIGMYSSVVPKSPESRNTSTSQVQNVEQIENAPSFARAHDSPKPETFTSQAQNVEQIENTPSFASAHDSPKPETFTSQAQNVDEIENPGSSNSHDSPKPEASSESSLQLRRRKRRPGFAPLTCISNNLEFQTSTPNTTGLYISMVPISDSLAAESRSTSTSQAQNVEQIEHTPSFATAHDSTKPETSSRNSTQSKRMKQKPGAKPNEVPVPDSPAAESRSTSTSQAQNVEQIENPGPSSTHDDSPKPETSSGSSIQEKIKKGRRGAKPNNVSSCRYCSMKLIKPRFSCPTREGKIYPEACELCSVKYPKLFITVVRSRYDKPYYKCSECNHRASTRTACMQHIIRHPDPNFRIRPSKFATIN